MSHKFKPTKAPRSNHHQTTRLKAPILKLPAEIMQAILDLALSLQFAHANDWSIDSRDLLHQFIGLYPRIPPQTFNRASWVLSIHKITMLAQERHLNFAKALVTERRAVGPLRTVSTSFRGNVDVVWNRYLKTREHDARLEFMLRCAKLWGARRARAAAKKQPEPVGELFERGVESTRAAADLEIVEQLRIGSVEEEARKQGAWEVESEVMLRELYTLPEQAHEGPGYGVGGVKIALQEFW